SEPGEKIIGRTFNKLRIRTVLAAIQRLDRGMPPHAGILTSAEKGRVGPQQVGFGYFLDRFLDLPYIDGAFKLLNECVGFFPHRTRIDALQPVEIDELEPGPKHRIGIDWKIFGHVFLPASPLGEAAAKRRVRVTSLCKY